MSGGSGLTVVETVEIARAPEVVWAIVKDFDAISRWHPAVASSPASAGNTVGSRRHLTLRAEGAPAFDEELLAYDAAGRSCRYSILEQSVLPVTGYEASFAVGASGAGTRMEWRATFRAAGASDEAAKAAMSGVFRGGLDAVKAMAEGA